MANHTDDPPPRPTIARKTASLVAAKTYWAHDPFADPASDNARLAAIATEFVGLFYQSLLKKHCRVAMGVEIEGSMQSRYDNALKETIHYINDTLQYSTLDNSRPNGIYRAYRDVKELEITTRPLKPLETIRYVKAIKKILATSTDEFIAAQTDTPHTQPDCVTLSPSAQRLRNIAAPRKYRFGSIPEKGSPPVLYGEHINISLHHTNSDTPSHLFNLEEHSLMNHKMIRLFEDAFDHLSNADQLLLFSQKASVTRAAKYYRYRVPTTLRHDISTDGVLDKGGTLSNAAASRLEWRVPDSASDIHLTTLIAMAIIYASVTSINKTCGTETLPKCDPVYSNTHLSEALMQQLPMPSYLPKKQGERVSQFEQHSIVLRMMRQLTQEMPTSEQPRLNAMIEEFKNAAIRQSNEQFPENHKSPKSR